MATRQSTEVARQQSPTDVILLELSDTLQEKADYLKKLVKPNVTSSAACSSSTPKMTLNFSDDVDYQGTVFDFNIMVSMIRPTLVHPPNENLSL